MDKIAVDEPSPLPPLPPPFCLPILKKYNNNNNNRNKSKTFSEQSKRMWGWNPQKPMKLDENDTILLHHPYILCNFCHVSFLLYTAARNPSFRYLLLNIAFLFSDIYCAAHSECMLQKFSEVKLSEKRVKI